MNHFFGLSATAPSSPTVHTSNYVNGVNGGKHRDDGYSRATESPTDEKALPVLPPPSVPYWSQSLNNIEGNGINGGRFDKPIPSRQYDSPYSRSLSSTAPGSPRIPPVRQNSGNHTPRIRPHATTLNIPGMTRSKASPDGRIPDRDVAAKLVIIMVGLPARGKSYITKKIQRYLNWQQHNTKIFNVGNRRRVVAGITPAGQCSGKTATKDDVSTQVATILSGGHNHPDIVIEEPSKLDLDNSGKPPVPPEAMDQSAKFFDPKNEAASKLREQMALDTLDELLDYLLKQGGAVGILDATNSTVHRRKLLVERIRQREPKLGILFIESICHDQNLLEANMRLKLSGPDYKDKDPVKSLEDFKARVKAYESAYEPLGKWEEDNDLQYIQMIDVGRKIINFRLRGFLSGGIASYLTTFNLSPRQIWITRHGQSVDNQLHKLGGNSELTERGHYYGEALYRFITHKRKEWLVEQKDKIAKANFPPQPGDYTPPYPELDQELEDKNFCVWTSMLKRSIETAEYFEADDDYDVKAWEMLNELNAGDFEGMTYEEIAEKYPEEYAKRNADKLGYVYPGVGGEGYLQVISRLRDMVREIERITDHVLIIAHRSVCRVLMAYFMDLTRDDIADLDVPLGMLYSIEPKPYGIEFHAYRYNEAMGWFDEVPNYKPRKTVDRNS
ncbi:6-phosphofructo-2-kinase 1-like protein [Thermochaetoides thermophila DSM 1495]|uniref:6-phosphofructo-2-kinase 1-like protein n=1 Tax=Chaetomium thermophilum (strain DSM 1495 / CBS 144.50 / IMI 039719) TaxID=759272 RepID=G0S011_CHATD|nr:6-phosphofructo-2-kinase 1-like protein [Thermochaetoides thermophila DSM 1495]EGS23172.1 6-phosphofructo-2-kinase 1-like protein [Thermochaetoides thermophila DSM 1495]